MDSVKSASMVLVVLAACMCMLANAMSIPNKDRSPDLDQLGPPEKGYEKNDLGERATWLDTRGLEDDFKELVFLALQELANEHRISQIVEEPNQVKKRGRWQGFCFRRTRNGRFLPYICWKGDRK